MKEYTARVIYQLFCNVTGRQSINSHQPPPTLAEFEKWLEDWVPPRPTKQEQRKKLIKSIAKKGLFQGQQT